MTGTREGQVLCPSCGAKLPTGQQYCSRCGTRVGIPPPGAFSDTPATGGYYAAQAARQGASSKIVGCIVAIVVGVFIVIIVGIIAAIALPNYIKVKEKAKEAEVKANLHNIQLAIERFGVDTEGAYPSFLIGGEPRYAGMVNTDDAALAFSQIQECDPLEHVSDTLLSKGYIDAYPRNPFVRSGIAIHQVQEDLPSSIYGNDPLRNDTEDGVRLGTRFGAYCTTMGSVLADPRTRGSGAWADVEYEFWDMWVGDKPLPFLPGMFFYKGLGPIVAIGTETAENEAILPTEIDQYMLGGYGGIRTKGKDILGEEQPLKVVFIGKEGSTEGDDNVYWPMTRSEVSDDPEDRSGCPFGGVSSTILDVEQYEYVNPNGIRDAIILVPTAGEDYAGDR